jgi:hypothetical protein
MCFSKHQVRVLWNNNLSSTGLSAHERTAGSVACRTSHKLTNCRVAAEWRDETTDTRIKSELIERQSERLDLKLRRKGRNETSYRNTQSRRVWELSKRTCYGTTAISRKG